MVRDEEHFKDIVPENKTLRTFKKRDHQIIVSKNISRVILFLRRVH